MTRFEWFVRLLSRRAWVRVGVISALGIFGAFVGIFVADRVPDGVGFAIERGSLENILGVLASSMLAVSVFSLSTMVSAYASASATVTPRAARLLMEDNTSQNVLGTFIGSFLYALVGVVALGTGLYGDKGRLILLAITAVLLVFIVATLLRWIDYLARCGRVSEVAERVEDATWRALSARLEDPLLGGREGSGGVAPAGFAPVHAAVVGYVQHVDVRRLSEALGPEGRAHVCAVPGTFVDALHPLCRVDGACDEDRRSELARCFVVGSERTFDQDPRFGFCVLAEVACRALSPAVNDPGTAIDVVGRALRLIGRSMEARPGDAATVRFDNVFVRRLAPSDIFEDVFAPIARDAGANLEVHLRIRKALAALHALGDAETRIAARAQADLALERARHAGALPSDIDRLIAVELPDRAT